MTHILCGFEPENRNAQSRLVLGRPIADTIASFDGEGDHLAIYLKLESRTRKDALRISVNRLDWSFRSAPPFVRV
jgi:hypothetical protein